MFKKGDTVSSTPRQVELDGGKRLRAKLGFILMSTDLAAETDMTAIAPETMAVHYQQSGTNVELSPPCRSSR